jgi:hypothetical protein
MRLVCSDDSVKGENLKIADTIANALKTIRLVTNISQTENCVTFIYKGLQVVKFLNQIQLSPAKH